MSLKTLRLSATIVLSLLPIGAFGQGRTSRYRVGPITIKLDKAMAAKLAGGRTLTQTDFDALMTDAEPAFRLREFKAAPHETVVMAFGSRINGEPLWISGNLIRDRNGVSMVIFSAKKDENFCSPVLAIYTSTPGGEKQALKTALENYVPHPERCK